MISISFTASSPYKVDAASVGQRAFTIFGSELNILNLKRTKGLSTFFVRASVLFRLACYELIVFKQKTLKITVMRKERFGSNCLL